MKRTKLMILHDTEEDIVIVMMKKSEGVCSMQPVSSQIEGVFTHTPQKPTTW